MSLKEIQIINKLTFCLKAIESFSATNDPNLIGTIYVVASEILKEMTPEIESIKNEAMRAGGYCSDKCRPRDWISGY
jgi:hypothetical protein